MWHFIGLWWECETFTIDRTKPSLLTLTGHHLLLDSLLTLAQTSIVPVILVTLSIPCIVVTRGQVDIGLSSRVTNEVIVWEGSTWVPSVLTILPSESSILFVSGHHLAAGLWHFHEVCLVSWLFSVESISPYTVGSDRKIHEIKPWEIFEKIQF